MKISKIDSQNNNFKGRINDCIFLKEALSHFNPAELSEFNNLKNKMSKVNDGKVFSVLQGSKFPQDTKYKNRDVFERYVQLASKENDKPMEFYEPQTYRVDSGSWRHITEGNTDSSAFAKAILTPLRNIYGNK